jgi:hypothetical protein
MLEWNGVEAVKNNVMGTRTIVDGADRHGVEAFVMLSTDKAVNDFVLREDGEFRAGQVRRDSSRIAVGKRVEHALKAEVTEVLRVVGGQFVDAVVQECMSESGVEDASAGHTLSTGVFPNARHHRCAVDQCPPRMGTKGLAHGCGVRSTERLSKDSRITKQHVQLDQNELRDRDIRSTDALFEEAASVRVFRTVAVHTVEQQIGVD